MIKGQASNYTFSKQYQRYYNYAFRLASFRRHNREDAEELVQDAFLYIWRHPWKEDRGPGFATYLGLVIHWCNCHDLTVRRKTLNKIPVDKLITSDFKFYVDPALSVIDRIYYQQLLALALGVSKKLKPEMRAVYCLSVFKQTPNKEIAAILGKSYSTVTSLLLSARKRAKQLISKQRIIEYGD